MFTVSWIDGEDKLQTICTPNSDAAADIAIAMNNMYGNCRVWCKGKLVDYFKLGNFNILAA